MPKVFRCFLSSHLKFRLEILQISLLKPSTSNCQIKFDFIEKLRSYRLFNMTAYRFFSPEKCSGYNTNLITSLKQHSWLIIKCQNSIVIVNVQSVHRQLQATTLASSCLIWEMFYSLVDQSLWQVAPDNLKRFLEFVTCFWLCFKLAVSLQHRTPHVIVYWVYIRRIWRTLVFFDEIWTAGPHPVLCAVWRCALCVLTHCPAGRWIQWAAFDRCKVEII